jgi:hypothetical protein
MDIDDIAASGGMMQPVDILGQYPHPLKMPFHLGDHLMAAVKPGVAAT